MMLLKHLIFFKVKALSSVFEVGSPKKPLFTLFVVPIDDASSTVVQKEQVLASYTMQQQTHKNFQSVRSHSPASAILAKGVLTSDEFKFGFPSAGLSAVSYKWWESSSLSNKESSVIVNVEAKELECESKESEKEVTPPANIKEANSNSPDPDSLTAIRKRAVEEGRETIKLGVCKRNAIQKPSSKQKKLLLKIFGASLESQWPDISSS
ncbi:hypothetical protein QQ045_025601 [Rhodiola kirilowii]